MNQSFGLGDRVCYRSEFGGVLTDSPGTVVKVSDSLDWGVLYAVRWDNFPYGTVSPATGQVYEVNEYPAAYLVLVEGRDDDDCE